MRWILVALVAYPALWACESTSVAGGNSDGGVDLDAETEPDRFLPPTVDARPDGPMLGMFGDPCDNARDCLSGFCIEAAEHGRICTRACGDCPEGFECLPIANDGPDRTFVCLADQPDLCKPCETDRECDDNSDLCLQIGQHKYCAEDCSADGFCPEGYECIDIDGGGDAGVIAQQCVPVNGEGCQPCADEDGDGYGDGADCLGFDCRDDDPETYEGAPELCDDIDNDCNSLVDDGDLEGQPDNLECLDLGICRGTRIGCLGGEWGCDYPESFELGLELSCDGLDNDCDGTPDDDFDLTNDPQNCAFCGNACDFANAAGHCVESSCELGNCAEGWHNIDGNDGNGCEYGCNETQDGVEVCDQIDNNCDGTADEGFDVQVDPLHCGQCNRECDLPNAVPGCEEGDCVVANCEAGWVNRNNDPRDGCEFECSFSNGGVEICDDIDNDCDGPADEDFDKVSGLEHCGGCNMPCGFEHGVAECNQGRCDFVECEEGWHNADGDLENGCEYACVLTLGGVEACDTIDNNCDGRVDETFADCRLDNALPRCVQGQCLIRECLGGFWDLDFEAENGCEYACQPTNAGLEICDDIDNDCDGEADEEAPVEADPLNCGECGNECNYPNAAPLCVDGDCEMGDCAEGFTDLDGDPETGCEYECQFVDDIDLPDPEGRDANCDGVDGERDRVVYLHGDGDDERDGLTPGNAVATIDRAVEIARVLPGRDRVLVATGLYRQASLVLVGGVSLHGGYSADFRTRDAERATFQFTNSVGVRAINLNAPVMLDQINIEVTNRNATGQPAIGFQVLASADHLHLRLSEVLAGRGGDGGVGRGGNVGADGNPGNAGSGSSPGGGGAPGGGNGGTGRRQNDGTGGGAGNQNDASCGGGGGGGGDDTGCADGDPRRGGDGGGGCGGPAGGNGARGNATGQLIGAAWVPSNGTHGGNGGVGGGGGGGGAGGGEDCVASFTGICIFCGTGRGGGGGGGGGRGGQGGRLGTGGGASIGFAVNNSTITLTDVLVATAGGGSGGPGGGGGNGGSGGPGGFGASNNSNTDGNGGNGGAGGSGGGGGCGGGGGGGPSVAVWGSGGAVVVQRGDVRLEAGAAGTGGGSCTNASRGLNGVQEGARNVELQ